MNLNETHEIFVSFIFSRKATIYLFHEYCQIELILVIVIIRDISKMNCVCFGDKNEVVYPFVFVGTQRNNTLRRGKSF